MQNWTRRVLRPLRALRPGAASLTAAARSLARALPSAARLPAGRPRIAAGIGAGLLVVAALAWALWPSPQPGPRARVYKDIDVCLLTDARGITADPARQAWQGLQAYSTATAVRVSYIPALGPATAKNAGQYLAGLVQRHCRVIVTAGEAQAAAVDSAAEPSPGTGFVVIGTIRQDRPNVVGVNPADTALAETVTAAVGRLMAR